MNGTADTAADTGERHATTNDGAARNTAEAQVEELLRAGAVLPPGTTGGGDRAVPVFTRAFRHPGVDGRVVVRLGAGDPPDGFLGLRPEGEPVEVGVGQQRAMGFPEWVLVRHPSDGHLAMSLVAEMKKVARTVRSRARKARAAYESIGERLAGSVPHFLPTFYEEAGRVFLAADERAYAAQMFVNARKAETAHALPFDEARMDTVFLEFALAGAMPTKVLSSYAKGLTSRVPAATAFRHLRGLFVRLAAHGLPPSSPGAADLRRLAKAAAGKDAQVRETEYLREMLTLPGTVKAPAGWWKAHRAALVALTRSEPAVRGTLLGMLPSEWEREELDQWLDLLEKTGAVAGLHDAGLPPEVRSPDGTAGWLSRFLERCEATRRAFAPAGLYPLVDRLADTIRAELAETGGSLPAPTGNVDLLDQLLALRIPVADPAGRSLDLDSWAKREQRRDLEALAADPRFRDAFLGGCPTRNWDGRGERTVLALAGTPGGRRLLAPWVAGVCGAAVRLNLAEARGLHSPLETLQWLPGAALATVEQQVRDTLAATVAPTLARTLRDGILDELGWPAWDEAVGTPASRDEARKTRVGEAWPHLIVLNGTRARVIGPEGTVLNHELRLPDGVPPGHCDLRYVDGALLVTWYSFDTHDSRGFWYRADADAGPPSPVPVEGDVRYGDLCAADGSGGTNGMPPASLPLPGGGRTTGHGVLRRGDTHVPHRRQVIGDGTSYWVWIRDYSDETNSDWHTYDPVADAPGERGGPDWFREGLRAAPEGSTLEACRLLPAPSVVPGPLSAPVDGLLGWRTVRLPDGSWRGEDLAGRTVVVPPGLGQRPENVLQYPGTDRLLTVNEASRQVQVRDPEGALVGDTGNGHAAGPFSAGTPLMPPLRYWHLLRPRDPKGSAALRGIGEDTAAALLTAAVAETPAQEQPTQEPPAQEPEEGGTTSGREALPGLVRTLLPDVEHEALRAGITGVVRYAAVQQRILDAALARLDTAIAGTAVPDRPRQKVGDELLEAAVNGVGLTGRGRRPRYYRSDHRIYDLPGLLGRSMRGTAEPVPPGRTHLGVEQQKSLGKVDALALPELPAVVALRAGAQSTPDEHREALRAFLAEFDEQGLTDLDPGHWRRVRLRLDQSLFEGPDALGCHTNETVLDLGGGAFLLFTDRASRFLSAWDTEDCTTGRCYGAVFHDPSGRFETPAPYTLVADGPFVRGPVRPAGWAAAFLTELAERGPAPWYPAAAEEFARLTGVTPTMARLVVAGLPRVDDEREAVPPATLRTIAVKTADASVAKDELRRLDAGARQAVVAALLPGDPSRLWTHGPDAARAAEVWNERLGRRTPVAEDVVHDAVRTVDSPGWAPGAALRGFVDLATEPRLTRDLTWSFGPYHLESGERCPGFDNDVLKGSVALAAWLAHRLPSGDPVRAVLPRVLTALHERLSHPGLLLALDRRTDPAEFRRTVGDPVHSGDGIERYGAVEFDTNGYKPIAAVRPALLDADGHEPYLAALFTGARPDAQETALRLVHDGRFAELLADPGDPAAGERDRDGLWWPQDPARSVPDLVTEVAGRYGLGADAAVLYLMLLAMPDPTDRNTARWTGWGGQRGGTARLRAARAELAATDLVVEGSRAKAGRSLFLPGGWTRPGHPHQPLERWKLPLYDVLDGETPVLGVVVPTRPVDGLYREAWQRVRKGDGPQLEELEVPRPRGRRR